MVSQRGSRAWLVMGGLVAVLGCSSYDSQLLKRPGRDVGVGVGVGTSDARVPDDAGGALSDGPSGAPSDSAIADSGGALADAQLDASAAGDAGGDADARVADAGCVAIGAVEDCCPDDATKTSPGQCGCGVEDTDGDGTADCLDECPQDANKTAPGTCGCGRADSDQDELVSCSGLVSALVHRYRFDGSGTAIADERGGADGVVVNTELAGTGQLELAGGTSDQYVDLPNGLISSLTDATIEVWVTWSGAGSWERIFDFGDNSNATEGNQGNGVSYLFLTPRSSGGAGALRAVYSTGGTASETLISAAAPLSTGVMHHVAVVVDDTGEQLLLYLDGAPEGEVAFTGALADIRDINNWLGRSQWSADPELGGALHELRIYGAALSASQIALSFEDGPDPAYLEP